MFLFCFGVVNQGEITSERLFIAKSCYQEWAAHALLTLEHALLTLCSRFAHALLTVLTLWGGVYLNEDTILRCRV